MSDFLSTYLPNYAATQAPSQFQSPNTLGQFYQNAGIGGGNLPGTAQLNSNTPRDTTGQVLGSNTGGSTGGSSGRDPHINDQGVWDDNYYAANHPSQVDAAQQAYNAENGRLNTQFDQTAAELNNQLGYLGTQKDSSLSQLDNAYNDAQNQVGTSKQNAQMNTDQQIQQAGSIAHSTQL